MLFRSRHPPSRSAIARDGAARGPEQRTAVVGAAAHVEPALVARAGATKGAAHTRFVCPGCGLDHPARRSARPASLPPLRCLCCEFLVTITDARTREVVRRVMDRGGLQRRLGGRDGPPVS